MAIGRGFFLMPSNQFLRMPYVITGALGESGEIQSLTIGALLPIMNPFSTAPLFVALTEGTDCKKRNRQALLACVYALGILVVFLLLGSAIIDFFRISIPGLRTAGGVIMSAIGFGCFSLVRLLLRTRRHHSNNFRYARSRH